MICEVDPPRPSTVAPAARQRELAGDLDNIILKALHKEPAHRYASMDHLSDDLGRWLDGLPVAARTSTFGYRARKLVRRNRGVVDAAALLVLTLIAATLVSLRQARRADAQAVFAEAQRASAIEAATRAETEAARARDAEARVKAELEQVHAAQAARAVAEADARAKGSEAELSREQLKVALTKAQEEKRLAEQASAQAHVAEARAESAARPSWSPSTRRSTSSPGSTSARRG